MTNEFIKIKGSIRQRGFNLKKAAALSLICLMFFLSACKGGVSEFEETREITVISREDGSGTRGAFTELFGVYTNMAGHGKVDATTEEAIITNNTAVMLYCVSTNPYAIGYISLGSMSDVVKSANVDGVAASLENVKNGTYKASRPFYIVTTQSLSAPAKDFISFILSDGGQEVVESAGYVPALAGREYTPSVDSGKVVVGGSSSVTPVMEKLKEAYGAYNPGIDVEVQQSDSTTGVSSTLQGICDIGMSSRALTENEKHSGALAETIALDGIVIIVNSINPNDDFTSEQIKGIFLGETAYWDSLEK